MRPHHRADDVVGRFHGAHPVAHRLVDRIAERFGAALHRPHLGSHELHAAHIRRLPPHILRAHVNHAVEAKPGTGRGGGNAMLAGAGFGDDPPLPHAHGEEPLTERVVDLVGAGVAEILTLEIDLRAAGIFGEPLGKEEGRWPPHEGGEEVVEFGGEGGIGPRLVIGRLQLIERRGERFGHIAAAKGAKPAEAVGHLRKETAGGRRHTGRANAGQGGRVRRHTILQKQTRHTGEGPELVEL